MVPNPGTVMARDHAVAERQIRIAWQRERLAFEQQHRAKLENYVDARLDLAEERARVELARAEQFAASRSAQASAAMAGSSGTAANATALAKSVAGSWVPGARPEAQPTAQPSTIVQKATDAVRHIVDQIPERTKEVFKGDDELVDSGMAHGLPKGIAIFLALLMLHIPSVALASLVTGVFLIRGHRPHMGSLFLGVAAVLGVVIFALLPW